MNYKTAVVWLGLCLTLTAALAAQETTQFRSGPDPVWLVNGARESAERAAAQPEHKTLWKASVAAVIAATVLDTHSSWGKHEANPLLANSAGRFGGQSIALKGLITGGALGAQWAFLRHNPSGRRIAAITNFALAGIYTRVAIHNYGNSR